MPFKRSIIKQSMNLYLAIIDNNETRARQKRFKSGTVNRYALSTSTSTGEFPSKNFYVCGRLFSHGGLEVFLKIKKKFQY